MLITLLKDEYLPLLDTLRDQPSFSSFVSTLGQMVAHGDHAIWAAPVLLDRLSSWPGISDGQSVALRAMARAITLGELPFKEVTDSLILTGPGGASGEPPGKTRWRRRDWTWLSEKGRLLPTRLGGENLNDAKWYLWLGRAYARLKKPGALSAENDVYVRCRGLGGSTAKAEISQEAANDDQPVLCILDSDRDHPSAPVGGTARLALEYVDEALKSGAAHLVHVEILKARDVENLFPLKVVESVADKADPWFVPMTQRGFFITDRVDQDLSYIDLNKDQCEERLLSAANQASRDYRERAIAKLRGLDSSCVARASCPKILAGSARCGTKTGDDKWSDVEKSCLLVHSVGKRLLPKIVERIEREDRPDRQGGAAWLAAQLPKDPAIVEPAELVWSWGLRLPARVRGGAESTAAP